MPCFDGSEREFDQHNNPQAEMLCTVLSTMADTHIKTLPINIRDWWKTHQARDAHKRRAEGIRKDITELKEKLKQKEAELQKL
jgi:hypothetical protein